MINILWCFFHSYGTLKAVALFLRAAVEEGRESAFIDGLIRYGAESTQRQLDTLPASKSDVIEEWHNRLREVLLSKPR